MRRLAIIPNLFLMILCILFCAPSLKAESEFEKGVFLLKQQQYDEAIAAFSKALEAEPDDFEAYHNRGVAWFYKGEYDKAIADYTHALEVNPNRAETYHNRGGAWFYKSRYDQAISDYTRGLEISPDDSEAYNNRGAVWYYKGDYEKAIADHAKALEISEDCAEAYQQMAWIFASCPIDEYRDGAKAVDMARKAVALKPLPNILDTLAAAYAETGQFEDAVKTQKEAIALLKESGRTQSLTKYGERLDAYENQQPWRDTSVTQHLEADADDAASPDAKADEGMVQTDQYQAGTTEATLTSDPANETPAFAEAEPKASEPESDEQMETPPDMTAAPEKPEVSETEAEEEPPLDKDVISADVETPLPEVKAYEMPVPAEPEPQASEPERDGEMESLPDVTIAPEEPKPPETEAADELPLDKDFRFADTETQELEIKTDENEETLPDALTVPETPDLSATTDVRELPLDELEVYEDKELQMTENITIGTDKPRKAEPASDEKGELPQLEAVIPLADNVPDESEPAIRYPYTVHILSYPPDDREKSNRVVERLRNEGKPALTTPIYHPGRRSWHHVLIGFYQTSEIAQQAASELREQTFRSPRVLERPYTIQIGCFESDQKLSKMESELRSKGYMAYKIPDTLDARKIRLLVGAFGTADMAKTSAENLEADGFEAKIVQR